MYREKQSIFPISNQRPKITPRLNEAFGREITRHHKIEINSMHKFMTSFVIRYLQISVKNCLYKFIKLQFTNKEKHFTASIPKVVGSNPTVARHIFQACPVWIYTQSSNYIHFTVCYI